jgi:hypothetical protein
MKYIIFAFLLAICLSLAHGSENYDFSYRSYDDILQQIQDFNSSYPFNIRMYNDQSEKMELPDVSDCGNQK